VTQRDRILIGVLGVVAILAGYWFVALKPKREELKQVQAQVASAQKRLDAAMVKVREGEEARRGFADDYATVARLGKAVPVDDQVPSLVYQLEDAADKTQVDFRSVKLRTDASGAASGPAAAPAPAAGGKVPATQAAAAVAPPGSAIGPAGFPTMPFAFSFEGDFFRMERMLSAIERFTGSISADADLRVSGRLLTVDGFGLKRSKLRQWPYIQASIMATSYVLPPDEGAFAGAEPGGPAGTPGSPNTQNAGAPAKGPRPSTATAGGIVP
jgi:type II secretory pathway pseudopilin PulG